MAGPAECIRLDMLLQENRSGGVPARLSGGASACGPAAVAP
jgi:hypothetical protein